jgi:hypothetical protein
MSVEQRAKEQRMSSQEWELAFFLTLVAALAAVIVFAR